MIQPERFRHAVATLWFGVLAYFVLCWFTGMGWLGPYWVLTMWSFAAFPLYGLTVLWGRRVRAMSLWEPFVVVLLWAGFLLAPTLPVSTLNLPAATLPGFYALVAVYTAFALLVVGRSLRLVLAAPGDSGLEAAQLPVRALIVLCTGYAVAAAWAVFVVAGPSYEVVATMVPDSAVDMVEIVWDDVLSVPTHGGTRLPEGVSSVARIADRDGVPAMQVRFAPGSSKAVRAALITRLRAHPAVLSVEPEPNQ